MSFARAAGYLLLYGPIIPDPSATALAHGQVKSGYRNLGLSSFFGHNDLYALPQRSHVTLTVFNALGQKVATLVDGDIDAGYRNVQFDASALATGAYFYRLQVRPLDSAIGPASPAGETPRAELEILSKPSD